MSDRYAVVGYPIAHSKSPLIHRLFAEQTGEDIIYEAILIDSEEAPFAEAVNRLRQQGYRGLNVTVPYKLDAFEFADTHTPRAEIAQAVNTLIFHEDGTVEGDNTDGAGLVMDIQELAGRPLAGQRILILGAGGAVQGVLKPLLDAGPATLHIANRTPRRAEALAQRFRPLTNIPLSASGFDTVPAEPFDIVINGTAASLEGRLPPVTEAILGERTLAYDMMYGAEPTVFMRWAHAHCSRCETRDGLGMLVGQAAEAFHRWRGIRPDIGPVLEAVRQQLQAAAR